MRPTSRAGALASRPAGGKGVVRQSGLTSIAATFAVISGLLLDVVTVGRFGAGGDMDAFVAAARLPLGVLAMLIATANQTLVPTFSTWMVKYTQKRLSELLTTFILLLWLILGAVAALLAVFAGPVMDAVAPGFDPATKALAADLARVTVLVVPLTASSEVLRAYLNARFSFVMPAAMTVILNSVSIMIIFALPRDIHTVPIAYVGGQVAQFLVMLFASWTKGLRIRPIAGLRHPEVIGTLKLCVRPLVSSGLNPAARIVELLFASYMPVGSATILHYGNRLISAVGGTVLFRSVTVAVVPRLTRAVTEGRREDAGRLTLLGARILISISFALTAFTVALAEPGAQLLFRRGRFDAHAATMLGIVLVFYAGSLVGSALQRALLSPFYAALDTRTPLRNTVYGVLANMILIPPAVYLSGAGAGALYAIALAYSLAQYVNAAHVWYRLRTDRDWRLDLSPLRAALVRGAAGACAATAVMYGVARALGIYRPSTHLHLIIGLTLALLAGLVVIVLSEGVGSEAPLRQLVKVRRERSGPGKNGSAAPVARGGVGVGVGAGAPGGARGGTGAGAGTNGHPVAGLADAGIWTPAHGIPDRRNGRIEPATNGIIFSVKVGSGAPALSRRTPYSEFPPDDAPWAGQQK